MELQNILVSACLLGENCKYNGGNNYNSIVAELSDIENVHLIPACAEQLGGLSTPRVPAERKGSCVINAEGIDVTKEFSDGAQTVLELAKKYNCKYAVLKERSPSCGCRSIYDGSFSSKVVFGQGVTAELLSKNGIKVFSEKEISLLKLILQKNTVPVLHFPNLLDVPGLTHASSTRIGGVSGKTDDTKHFSSMNLSFNCGDVREDVQENYRIFCEAADIPFDAVTFSAQTHTSNIRVIDNEDIGKGLSKERDYTDIDGLITDVKEAALTIFSADCVPILFADRQGRAIGAAHCGWKGTFALLQKKMIEKFSLLYNIEPSNILVAVGPCIHVECYEVDENLYGKFIVMLQDEGLSNEDISAVAISKDSKFYLDLPHINELLIQKAGVPSANIYVSDLCTSCHSDFLFSHRASHGKRGLLASMIMLNE